MGTITFDEKSDDDLTLNKYSMEQIRKKLNRKRMNSESNMKHYSQTIENNSTINTVKNPNNYYNFAKNM